MENQAEQSKSNISERIRKLLALAEGNQNEHERNAAMKLAMDLLAKHNLDLATVGDTINAIKVIEYPAFIKLDPWIRSVLNAACKLYYTDYIMRSVTRAGYYNLRNEWHPTFIGTEENIAVTIEMASWLMASIRQESNWLYAEQYERRSFRLGAAHKLLERASKLVADENSSRGSSNCNSLMILRNDLEKANERFLGKMDLDVFRSRGSYTDSGAYGSGQSFGDSVNLGRSTRLKAITMR